MAKRGSRLLLSLCSAVVLAGCGVIGQGPVMAPITVDMRGPVAMGTASGQSKVGRAEAYGILLFATGDASISAAMKNGGISRVHHVDHETMSILWVYSKYTTIVYGE